jgi:hypothetical protein
MHPFASRKPSHTDALPGVVAQPRGAPLDVPAGPASRTCIRARAAVRRDRDLSRLPAADRQARAGSTSWWLVSGWVQVILPLTTYFLPRILTTYHLPLTTYHLPLTTYHLPLTTYHLPLTTYHLLLTRAAHRVTHLHARAAAAARARATPLPAQGKWVSREIPRATWLARYTIPAPPTLQHRLTLTCLLAYLLTAQGAVGHPHAAAAVARLPHAQKPPRRRARNRAAPASARDARSQEQRAR